MTTRLEETKVTELCTIFVSGDARFVADFVPPGDRPGLVEHENQWRLSRMVYHSHREGREIKARSQRPRYKVLGYFSSLDECRQRLLSEE